MIIVVSYTPSYKQDFKQLLQPSLEKFEIKYDAVEIPNKGNWSYNTYYTPELLLQMLSKHNEPVCKLNVDTIIRKFPQGLYDMAEKKDFDIAITYKPLDDIEHPECSTVMAQNTEKAKWFCERWKKECDKNIAEGITSVKSDQDVLWEIMGEMLNKVKVIKIPIAYGQSYHFNKSEIGEPIIEEFRTSWNHDRNRV